MRNPVHDDLDRDGHLLLHFFGGMARPLRDHLDIVVGHVRVGFNRKVVKGNCSPRQ